MQKEEKKEENPVQQGKEKPFSLEEMILESCLLYDTPFQMTLQIEPISKSFIVVNHVRLPS